MATTSRQARLAANNGMDAGADGGVGGRDITHRHRLVDGGGRAGPLVISPSGSPSTLVVAGARAPECALSPQAHAQLGQRHGAIQLAQHRGRTRKSRRPASSAHFLHGPVESGFHGGGGGVDVVTVQAQPGFQAQRIAGLRPMGLTSRWASNARPGASAAVSGTEISKPSSPV